MNHHIRNFILTFIIVSMFLFGFLLGSIAYDINPKGKNREYELEVYTDEESNITVKHRRLELDDGDYFKVEIVGLNRSANYLLSRVTFSYLESHIYGASVQFTNRTFISFCFGMAKMDLVLWENHTTHIWWLCEVYIAEKVTTIDIIQAFPRFANFDLLSIFTGFLVGGIMNLYFLVEKRMRGKTISWIKTKLPKRKTGDEK